MRHRASDLSPAFDPSALGGGLDGSSHGAADLSAAPGRSSTSRPLNDQNTATTPSYTGTTAALPGSSQNTINPAPPYTGTTATPPGGNPIATPPVNGQNTIAPAPPYTGTTATPPGANPIATPPVNGQNTTAPALSCAGSSGVPLSSGFDTAGYGGGFVLESAGVSRGGFEPVAAPAAPPALRRRGRPVAVAGMAAVALVGVTILVAGATQVVQRDQLAGLASPLPGPQSVAVHQAPAPAGVASRHQPPVAHGSVTGPTSRAAAAPRTSATTARPAQGTQLPNTIRLPRGGTAYLVHVQVANDGTLPIPSGVDQAVWWGTGLTASTGATVFAGHVNWAGVTGPFAELWQDRLGAVITVRDNSGKQWRYRVTRVLTLNKSTLPKQAPSLFSASGPQRIVVATCGGEWVGGSLGYADNRVMIATPVR